MSKWLLPMLVLAALGCGDKKVDAGFVPHYDLSAQLRKHIKTLYAEKAHLIKYVVYNGKPDQVINRKPDWNKEFDVLFDADLHAPALVGLYDIDTTLASDSTLRIAYKAKADDQPLQQLVVRTSHQGDLIGFDAVSESKSMLSQRTQTMKYERFRSYEIKVSETNKYTEDNAYTVIGEIHIGEEYFQ